MSDTPHTCGPRNRGDCYACVRSDLDRTLSVLRELEAAQSGEASEDGEGEAGEDPAEPTEE